MIFLLRIAMSISSPALSPVLLKLRWHTCFNFVFSRPLFLFPCINVLNTFPSMCSSSLLYHMPVPGQYSLGDLLEARATLVAHRMWTFLILSLRVIPHVHRSIVIALTSMTCSCHRSIIKPKKRDGEDCEGDAAQTDSCNTDPCPMCKDYDDTIYKPFETVNETSCDIWLVIHIHI